MIAQPQLCAVCQSIEYATIEQLIDYTDVTTAVQKALFIYEHH